ncbi:hypothetical protein F2Q69_00052034 [Brassica cretica]|uniref:Uncharacterized protein n=1 Tax=Brassica cretica TaxID=69181 RepID=A0A8S9N1S1_BRACR|nr:hypothetical protein F2Q69_00052034 [Brassica cretica]
MLDLTTTTNSSSNVNGNSTQDYYVRQLTDSVQSSSATWHRFDPGIREITPVAA